MKPGPVVALCGVALAVGTFVARPPAAAGADARPAAAQAAMHHAAVVVDTGDGVVRKMCLTFPEDELSGIEALQRVDTRPYRFETFSGKGSGVCMLCGVGCASGDCFCDPAKYWAYYRSGPGDTKYTTSAMGASNTVVRDGDVEAWKWGNGSTPPMKTTVSEVCGVEEPPSRTAAATTTSTTASAPTTTAEPPAAAPSTTAATTATTAPSAAPAGAGGTRAPSPSTTTAAPADPATPAPAEPGAVTDTVVPDEAIDPADGADEDDSDLAAGDDRRTSARTDDGDGAGAGRLASLAAFGGLLGGLLVWRSRLRRAKVRRMRPVR